TYIGRQWDAPRTFVSPDSAPGDLFGFSVFRDGREFYGYLIGAPGANRAYHFHTTNDPAVNRVTRLNGSSVGAGTGFGYAVAGHGGALAVSAPWANGGGAVLVFPEHSPPGVPASAEPTAVLRPSVGTDRRFGAALAAGQASCGGGYCQRFAVGAPGMNGADGAVYVFKLAAEGVWVQEARIPGPPGFGTHVSLYASRLAVTVPGTDSTAGAVYVYGENPTNTWTLGTVHQGPGARYPGSLAFRTAATDWYFLTGALGTLPDAEPLPVNVLRRSGNGNTVSADVPSPAGASPAFGAAVAYTTTLWAIGDPGRGPGAVTLGTSSIIPVASEEDPAPSTLRLSPPVPNPASDAATVRLDVPTAADVRVALYDVLGREVAVVQEGPMPAGTHVLTIEGARLPAGVYVLRAAADAASVTTRLTIAR
ncbi:MAG TPA: T9SS type A sorting domain-containing protein, partial [Rhodothermales bacterium]|nr:T9SS type A sorting domain-containing protein [Rhodothermales bacterium]